MTNGHIRELVEEAIKEQYDDKCPHCEQEELNLYLPGHGGNFAVNCGNCDNMVISGTPGAMEFKLPVICDCGNEKIWHNGDEGWYCPFCNE